MSAESINKWLSLGANIGVVIGLILLLVEIDQNSDLDRAQIHQARSDQHVSNRLQNADSEFLMPAPAKFFAAGDVHTVLRQFTGLGSMRPIPGSLFGFVGSVLLPAAVALDLPTHC